MAASVLVVDDDLDIRATVSQILRDEGFRVRSARNGLEALEKIAEEDPDLVVLDLMMPVMSGWDLLAALRRSRKHVAVVVLSAFPVEEGVDRIEKPISYDRLMQLLATVHARVGGLSANDSDSPIRVAKPAPEEPSES
jgi:CheY-like chemotaxis protein